MRQVKRLRRLGGVDKVEQITLEIGSVAIDTREKWLEIAETGDLFRVLSKKRESVKARERFETIEASSP
jgi:hypothetical protein